MSVAAQTVGTWGRLTGNAQLRGHFGRIPFALGLVPDHPVACGGNTVAMLGSANTVDAIGGGNRVAVLGGGNTIEVSKGGNTVESFWSNTVNKEEC